MTNPKLEVLTPQNSQVLFIDQQPQMAFGVQSIDRQTLKNNVVALAKGAKVFKIPTTITSVESESFSGFTYPELLDVFPDKPVLERTSMNSWDDKKVREALKANGRNKVVVSGLWTEVCNNTFALSAMLADDGLLGGSSARGEVPEIDPLKPLATRASHHAPKAKSCTRLGWFSCAASLASPRNISTNCGSSARCGRMRLMTRSFSKPMGPSVLARNTSAIPPVASLRSSWYFPSLIWT